MYAEKARPQKYIKLPPAALLSIDMVVSQSQSHGGPLDAALLALQSCPFCFYQLWFRCLITQRAPVFTLVYLGILYFLLSTVSSSRKSTSWTHPILSDQAPVCRIYPSSLHI